MSHRLATACLSVLMLLTAVFMVRNHHAMPLPPHSAHDGFILIPQLVDLIEGQTPVDGRFGMFQATWFSDRVESTHAVGWAGFAERIVGNVQSHTWIDAPHPMAWMALVAHLLGIGTWAAVVVQWIYLCLLIASLYLIGRRVRGPLCGLMAGLMGLGSPGIMGTAQYIEPHLAVVSVSTVVVCLLLHVDGLKRWGVGLLASVALWSLSRSGEGSGDAVIAGLVVVGPVLVTLARADQTQGVLRIAMGVGALMIPFLLLADLPWMMAAMERVTRAFADPQVQTDVVAKGGVLAHPAVWTGAYAILLVTDYALPCLSLLIVLGLTRLPGTHYSHRLHLILWAVVPWLALSWMQRKASWYGFPLLPPILVLASIGLSRLGTKARWIVVGVCLSQWWFTQSATGDTRHTWLTRPLPLEDWRLRRIDLFRPMDTPESRRTRHDLDAVVAWAEGRGPMGPVGLLTMGSQHDYAARYYLSMSSSRLQVVSLTDPRTREAKYRGLHPRDFSSLLFLDGRASAWPPTSQQRAWLNQNLGCQEQDLVDAFVGALWARANERKDGFYTLSGPGSGELGPGQIWSGPAGEGVLCAP